ncbi:hypothetical protein Trydic_g12346 [Trypoxylus dichotomus]
MIKQVNQLKYLGADTTSSGHLDSEALEQKVRASQIAGCLRDIIWRNKYLERESKMRVYKSAVRPVITYTAERWPDTSKTQQMTRTVGMKTTKFMEKQYLAKSETKTYVNQAKYNTWEMGQKTKKLLE